MAASRRVGVLSGQVCGAVTSTPYATPASRSAPLLRGQRQLPGERRAAASPHYPPFAGVTVAASSSSSRASGTVSVAPDAADEEARCGQERAPAHGRVRRTVPGSRLPVVEPDSLSAEAWAGDAFESDDPDAAQSASQLSRRAEPASGSVGRRVGITFEYEDRTAVPTRRRVRVRWHCPIRRVLLVKKWHDAEVLAIAQDMVRWLAQQGVAVLVEPSDVSEYDAELRPSLLALDTSGETKQGVDLVISLGGDGTLLHAARLFRFLQRSAERLLPPCLVLGMGSMGFLATVPATNWQRALERAMRGHESPLPCTLRTRLLCKLVDSNREQKTAVAWHALNECAIVSRGEAIGKLQLFVDGTFVTLVEGDGLIISTPTGSTGYSLSCGGSIISPSVPCLLLTPVAPASLSFRPLVVSELSKVEVRLPVRARTGEASVVIDGRGMGVLERGDRVLLSVARPIPVLNVESLDNDWFQAITKRLKWNIRDVEQADA